MGSELLFVLQALGVAVIGALIGECRRSTEAGWQEPWYVYVIDMVTSVFLAVLLAYWGYSTFFDRPAALVVSGLLSFQGAEFLIGLSRRLLARWTDKE